MTAWIAYRKPNPQAQLRLFCFPYAGGSASIFRNWSEALPSFVEVCPVQYPGREMRLGEPPITRMTPLIDALARELSQFFNLPMIFFGHSMGALVAFEFARRLRSLQQQGPKYLFVSAHEAPQLSEPEMVEDLNDDQFIERLRSLNGTPQAVLEHRELMELMLPVLRADFAVLDHYRYDAEPPLDCSIAAFGGVEDEEVSEKALAAWREQTKNGFFHRLFPGDHFYLQSARQQLLRVISQLVMEIVK